MERVRVDWHIHTTLSPCGSLSMDPLTILQRAEQMELQVIGITDHNSTRQGRQMKSDFPDSNLMILTGAEVTTREEIHCLAFFDDNIALDEFQNYLDLHLSFIPNNTDYFGDQVVVNSKGKIVYQENRLLITALDQSLDEVSEFVFARGGIFIPAHINRPCFSLLSQLGFIPLGLKADAIEWVPGGKMAPEIEDAPGLSAFPVVYSSDAHQPEAIGTRYTELEITERSFAGIKKGIAGILKAGR